MINTIKQLFWALTREQRKQFYRLQILVVLMAIVEIFGLAMIGPFIAIVSDENIFQTNSLLHYLYSVSGFSSQEDFVFMAGALLLLVLAIGAVLSIFTIWKLSVFGARVGTEIGDRLFVYYLNQPWMFHAANNSSYLTKQISTESIRLTDFVIIPLMQMNSKIVLSFLMIIALVVLNPLIAVIGVIIFAGAFFLIYKLVKTKLTENGEKISTHTGKRFHLLSLSLGGIRDILLLHKKNDLIRSFKANGVEFSRARGVNQALSIIPRYFVEFLTFSSVIILLLFVNHQQDESFDSLLPLLAIYGLAALKLLPAFQLIYNNVAVIRGNLAAFESIRVDLKNSCLAEEKTKKNIYQKVFIPKEKKPKGIQLNKISFSYPSSNALVLNDLCMTLPSNQVIGLVGPSGSGKSTVIDLLLGLVTPDSGEIVVDGVPLGEHNYIQWQKKIGFVPQSIFLFDASIAENITFSLSKESIDFERVQKVIQQAHLSEFVASLPEGLHTIVGERGVLLSGGQKQRIGIARALYNDAEVLILDEATSALDGVTEKIVMDAIHDFSGHKTIIMIAHRLSTVEFCDTIYYLDKGRIINQGSYRELLESNHDFRAMANINK